MSKVTVPLRDAALGSRSMVAEQLPGGTHLINHLASAIRPIVEKDAGVLFADAPRGFV